MQGVGNGLQGQRYCAQAKGRHQGDAHERQTQPRRHALDGDRVHAPMQPREHCQLYRLVPGLIVAMGRDGVCRRLQPVRPHRHLPDHERVSDRSHRS